MCENRCTRRTPLGTPAVCSGPPDGSGLSAPPPSQWVLLWLGSASVEHSPGLFEALMLCQQRCISSCTCPSFSPPQSLRPSQQHPAGAGAPGSTSACVLTTLCGQCYRHLGTWGIRVQWHESAVLLTHLGAEAAPTSFFC